MPAPSGTNDSPRRPHWLQIVTIGRNPQTTLVRIVILVALCVVVFHFILLPVRVDGISMEPTYNDHSINFVNRLAFLWRPPRRGDIVAVRYAGIHLMLMKRIVGLPGETIAFDHGRVLINGRPLDEPYEKWKSDWTLPPEQIATNEYFVVGDNRTMPPQDHTFGRVNEDRIVGKILL